MKISTQKTIFCAQLSNNNAQLSNNNARLSNDNAQLDNNNALSFAKYRG